MQWYRENFRVASRVKELYFGNEMILKNKYLSSLLFVLGLVAFSSSAQAENAGRNNSPVEQSATSTSGDETHHSGTATRAKDTGHEAVDDDFVDKDGDGIRDGKEHRFRRRSKHGKDADRKTGKQRRKRAQRGKAGGA